jgi:hypothetical protein
VAPALRGEGARGRPGPLGAAGFECRSLPAGQVNNDAGRLPLHLKQRNADRRVNPAGDQALELGLATARSL